MSLDSLLHRYLDDRASLAADELDALVAGLRAEPARAVALYEQLQLDDLLAQKLTVDRRNFAAQVGQRIADYQRGQEELDSQVVELRSIAETEIDKPAAWSGNSPWVKVAIGISLAVVVAAVMLVPRWLPRTAQPVAKVTAVAGAVNVAQAGGSGQAAIGQALFSGQQIETPADGSLTLEYADKTSVQIAGGSTVAFTIDETSGAKRVTLDHGELVANVAPQSAGAMVFNTPHAVATVLGTQLRLTVNDVTTLLEVTEGKVRLNRRADGQSIQVAAHETGLASGELLQVRRLAWPDSREGLMYLLSPVGVLDVPPPAMVARNPATDRLIETPLEMVGDAQLDPRAALLVLEGGYAHSPTAGEELLPLWRQRTAFTVEVVFTPGPADEGREAGRIVGLGPSDRPNFALSQRGERLALTVQGASELPPATLDFALPAAPGSDAVNRQRAHLILVYGGGSIAAYAHGQELARAAAADGLLAGWDEGPLTLGAAPGGAQSWRGTVEALALYDRALSTAEIERNARSYRLLLGPE